MTTSPPSRTAEGPAPALVEVLSGTHGHHPTQEGSRESAFLFWLKAACAAPIPAPPPRPVDLASFASTEDIIVSSPPLAVAAAVAADVPVRSTSVVQDEDSSDAVDFSQRKRQRSTSILGADVSLELPCREAGGTSAPVPLSPNVTPSPVLAKTLTTDTAISPPWRQREKSPSSSAAPPPRLVMADGVPLLPYLLAGRLGPVAVDVQLRGCTSLLRHPQLFDSVLQAYERQSAGALRDSLGTVQPFFFLCRSPSEGIESRTREAIWDGGAMGSLSASGVAASASAGVLYTIDPRQGYPVIPLLAQLLRSPDVLKLLLHSRLLYRLLFIFLGTDRIDIENVVEVKTCTELGFQLRHALASMFRLPEHGVQLLEDVTAALPPEVVELLNAERQSIQELQPRDVAMVNATAHIVAGDGVVELTSGNDSDSSEGSSSIAVDEENDVEPSVSNAAGIRTITPPLPTDVLHGEEGGVEKTNVDAVGLLARLTSLESQPHDHHQRRRAASTTEARAAEGNASTHLGRSSPRPHRTSVRPLRGRVMRRERVPVRDLADVYHSLKSLALFFDVVLRKLLDGVGASAQRAPRDPPLAASSSIIASATAASRYRLSPSELCHQRTYAEFLCELMTYHGIFVNDAMARAMLTELDQQLASIEALGLRVVKALVPTEGNEGPERPCYVRWNADTVSRCLSQLASAAAVTPPPQKLDAVYLRRLATAAAARPEGSPLTRKIRLACQLACVWIAHQDRTEARHKIAEMFDRVAEKLRVRVLDRPQEDLPTSPPLTVSSSTAAAPNAKTGRTGAARVCYSVHPTWTLHNSTTGRIFATTPNVQTVAKSPLRTTFPLPELCAASSSTSDAHGANGDADQGPTREDVDRWLGWAEGATGAQPLSTPTLLFPHHPQWTLRHLYCAPPGCVLISFDFNQLELRLLAHLSGDVALQKHLSTNVDVLALMTASVLQRASAEQVRPLERQAVKVVVYGLLYGMGPDVMDLKIKNVVAETARLASPPPESPQQEQQQQQGAAAPLAARELIARFYKAYPRLQSYLRETRREGLHAKAVETLSGFKSLATEKDPARRKQRAVALAIQGGAADVLHGAMRAVHQRRHTLLPYLPAAPLALVMSIHDELVYAVPRAAVGEVAHGVQRILEDQARALRLAVPLPVSVRVGETFGDLKELRSARGETEDV